MLINAFTVCFFTLMNHLNSLFTKLPLAGGCAQKKRRQGLQLGGRLLLLPPLRLELTLNYYFSLKCRKSQLPATKLRSLTRNPHRFCSSHVNNY